MLQWNIAVQINSTVCWFNQWLIYPITSTITALAPFFALPPAPLVRMWECNGIYVREFCFHLQLLCSAWQIIQLVNIRFDIVSVSVSPARRSSVVCIHIPQLIDLLIQSAIALEHLPIETLLRNVMWQRFSSVTELISKFDLSLMTRIPLAPNEMKIKSNFYPIHIVWVPSALQITIATT